MGLQDTFDFDADEYARAIRNESVYTTHRLVNQDIVKFRQEIAGYGSVGAGALLAPFTGGLSLLGSAWGARRIWVATQKRDAIEAELARREVQRREVSVSDVVVPLIITGATLGVAHGADVLLNHATSEVAVHAMAPHGIDAISAAATSAPEQVVNGAVEGVTNELHELGALANGGVNEAIVASNIDASFLAGAPPAEMVGVVAGTAATHWAASEGAQALVSHGPLKDAGNRFRQARANIGLPTHCPRRADTTNPMCDSCGNWLSFKKSRYFHCCKCNVHPTNRSFNAIAKDESHGWNGCAYCVVQLHKTCHDPTNHVLIKVSPAAEPIVPVATARKVLPVATVNEIAVQPPEQVSMKKKGPNVKVKKPSPCTRLGNNIINGMRMKFTDLSCQRCNKRIGKSKYYHCCDCFEDNYDQCKKCGKGCQSAFHAPMVKLRERRNHWLRRTHEHCAIPEKCQWFAQADRDDATCVHCTRKVTWAGSGTWTFLHCCKCRNQASPAHGKGIDVCKECAMRGLRCRHKMRQLTAWGRCH